MRKRIYVRGDQFLVGSEHRPYVMRTSFCLLGHYQSNNGDKAKRWLDRIKEQGFDGPRVLAENTDWFADGGGAFFGSRLTPRVDAYNGPPDSRMKIRDGYADMLWRFVRDLDEREMVAEFVAIATIKGRHTSWTANGLNAMAQLLRENFDAVNTPLLHEAVNEASSHDGIDDNELPKFGSIWRRSDSRPSYHNYPDSTIGISNRANKRVWHPGFDDRGYTHRNFHPPRKESGREWWQGERGEPIGKTCQSMRADARRPVAFNEIIHYMTVPQWDEWISSGRIPKWSNISTTDAKRITTFCETVLRAGVSVCWHDYVGMMTDPDETITRGELMMRELLTGTGGGGQPPKTWPPDEPWRRPYDKWVVESYEEIFDRSPDPNGRKHWNEQLELFYGGDGSEGTSVEGMRDSFRRGDEYREKNDGPWNYND